MLPKTEILLGVRFFARQKYMCKCCVVRMRIFLCVFVYVCAARKVVNLYACVHACVRARNVHAWMSAHASCVHTLKYISDARIYRGTERYEYVLC